MPTLYLLWHDSFQVVSEKSVLDESVVELRAGLDKGASGGSPERVRAHSSPFLSLSPAVMIADGG